MTTTDITPRVVEAVGWNWRPGTFRCSRGYNASGVSFGCREPGVMKFGDEWLCRALATRKVNAEWLCDEHAQDIPTSDEMDYRDCPECRADRGMEHRPGFPGAWYWCPGCNTDWREPGHYPGVYRPSAAGIAYGIFRVLYTLALMVAFATLGALWFEPDFANVSDGRQAFASLGGAGLALFPALAGGWLINEILYWSAYGLGWAARYVLGGPVQKGGADNA